MPGLSAGPISGELLTNEDIHNTTRFNTAASPEVRWLGDGHAYTVLERRHGLAPTTSELPGGGGGGVGQGNWAHISGQQAGHGAGGIVIIRYKK